MTTLLQDYVLNNKKTDYISAGSTGLHRVQRQEERRRKIQEQQCNTTGQDDIQCSQPEQKQQYCDTHYCNIMTLNANMECK